MGLALSDTVLEQAKALYYQGLRPSEIGKRLNLKSDTIQKRAKKEGWQAIKGAINVKVAEIVSGSIVKTLSKKSARLKDRLANELHAQMDAIEACPVKSYPELASDGQGRAGVVKTITDTGKIVFGWDAQPTTETMFCNLDAIDAEVKDEPLQLPAPEQPNK